LVYEGQGGNPNVRRNISLRDKQIGTMKFGAEK